MKNESTIRPDEILRIVDEIYLDRKIDRETVFVSIEQALAYAARKHGDGMDDSVVDVRIDRSTGDIYAYRDNVPLSPSEITERIGAQTAKQVIIQKIHDAECDMIYDEYYPLIGQIVSGEVQRAESARGGLTTVRLPSVDAIIPRNEKIPREIYHRGDHINALVVEVEKKNGKVRVVLSRSRPLFVQRLFEQAIPEIADGTIQIVNVSREAGRRSKVAVTSSDPRIDLVGACVGVRGARSRAITDELGGERVDVVPYSPDASAYVSSALKPAVIDEVMLCSMLGRAIVLVQPDQRSLAIGRGGQNVRLASRLCDWDVDVMTREELDDMIEGGMRAFTSIDGVSDDLADQLVGQGYLTYDDLSVIEPDELARMGNITIEEAEAIAAIADERAQEEEAQRELMQREEAAQRDFESRRGFEENMQPAPEEGSSENKEEN